MSVNPDFRDLFFELNAAEARGVPINVFGLDDLIASKKAAGRPHYLLDIDWLEKSRGQ